MKAYTIEVPLTGFANIEEAVKRGDYVDIIGMSGYDQMIFHNLYQDYVIVVATRSQLEQVDQNLTLLHKALDEEDMEALDELEMALEVIVVHKDHCYLGKPGVLLEELENVVVDDKTGQVYISNQLSTATAP